MAAAALFTTETPKPPRCKRWIPLSLKLFVAMLVLLGVGSVLWVGVGVYRQQAAIREIERLGGTVTTRPTGPNWLRDLVGAEFMRLFDESDWIQLGDRQATDATLRQVGVLTGTRTLWLDGAQISDAGLKQLNNLTDLGSLRLNRTQVSDAGLANLKDLRNLSVISLDHTRITEAGLAHLRQLPHLQVFCLSDTRVSDAGIAELKRAIPNSAVIVDPALAAAADPPAPQSNIVRFRFRKRHGRVQTAQGLQELPEIECGELIFERVTGRCVYRYWDDDAHERWLNAGSDEAQVQDTPRKVPDRGVPLKGAAGFDGQRYWAASFGHVARRFVDAALADRRVAARIVIYHDDNDLARRDGIDRNWVNLPTWYHWAPLHDLAATVGSRAIERVEFHRAVQSSPRAERIGPHAFSVKVGRCWRFVVSLDNSPLGIRRVAVEYSVGMFFGHYPLPMPMGYSMECENAEDMSSERLDVLTDPDTYAGEATAFDD